MRKRLTPVLAVVVLTVTGWALFAASPIAGAAPVDGIHNIQHVVVIMQENRSFDNYFGTYPGANGIPAGVCAPDPLHGGCVGPFHDSADLNYGGPHAHHSHVTDVDGGKMDGFVGEAQNGLGCSTNDADCSPCVASADASQCKDVMGYHDAREIPNYWTYANNFVLQDKMFEPISSRSWPAHLQMVSGWSARCTNYSVASTCTSAVEPEGPGSGAFTTLPWTDVTHLLFNAGVSWAYYVFKGTEPDCESGAPTCTPQTQGPQTPSIWNPLPYFQDVADNGQLGNVQTLDNFFTAVNDPSSCGLPNVSWVIPNGNVSEHPPALVSAGQTYVTNLINHVMSSPCWNSTAIFLSWDDWGGFYDHVVPPVLDQLGYGIRVPGLVISPYAKTGYIDHEVLSHDAYLKFIEDVFLNGQRLDPATDGRPDPRPSVRENLVPGDLINDFDFTQTPRPPLLLPTNPPPGPASTPPAYVRPRGASPLKVPFVPAFKPCTAPNSTHGQPLAFGSCAAPEQSSDFLTVGTPDSNGLKVNSFGSMVMKARAGVNADVLYGISISDIRNKSDLSDYTGELQLDTSLRITDHNNTGNPDGPDSATVSETDFPVTVPCAATADTTIGSTCSISTSADALVPNAVVGGQRMVWQLGPVQVYDGGASGVAGSADATLFADQGLFVP
jgi:phospholipase C